MLSILYIIAVILIVLWLIGFVANIAGGLISYFVGRRNCHYRVQPRNRPDPGLTTEILQRQKTRRVERLAFCVSASLLISSQFQMSSSESDWLLTTVTYSPVGSPDEMKLMIRRQESEEASANSAWRRSKKLWVAPG